MYQNYSAITKYVATFVKIRTNDFMTYGFEREVLFISLLSSNLKRDKNLNCYKYLYISCNEYLQNKSFLKES